MMIEGGKKKKRDPPDEIRSNIYPPVHLDNSLDLSFER
jgi:hypothetical protein